MWIFEGLFHVSALNNLMEHNAKWVSTFINRENFLQAILFVFNRPISMY